ncbi:MAG: hypothetical protein U0W24_17450 [Bacteroidales bacterium]
MKKYIFIMLAGIWSFSAIAQENDTTKIKLGDTKIIIIEKDQDKNLSSDKERLEKGKEEFEKMQEEKHAQLEKEQKRLEEQMQLLENQQDEAKKKELEQEIKKNEESIKDLEKEIEALDKGLEDIQNELDKDSDNDFENEEEFDNDDHDKYNWDFEEDWPSDWDNLSPFGKSKKFRGHWAGFDIGLNNYVDKDFKTVFDTTYSNFELNGGASWVYSLNFLEFNIPFGRSVGLVTGMGTTWNNYRFRNNVNVYENANGIIVAETELQKDYYKVTMNTWTFTVPLIFEFQIPVEHKKPGVFFGFGLVGSAKVLSWGKQNYWLDSDRIKIDRRSDYAMNTFRYGVTARVGFKYLKIFANYDLTPLFKEDRGPELYPVSVGLTLLSF